MTTHNILVFLWGTLFGYLWSSFMIAALLIKLGYKTIHQIPKNEDKNGMH